MMYWIYIIFIAIIIAIIIKIWYNSKNTKNDDSSDLNQIYWNCIRELYETSEHISGVKVDFDKIYNEAPLNEDGRKFINYDEYYLDRVVFEEIANKYISKLPEWKRKGLSMQIYLGSSPTSNKERWDELKKNLENKVN